MTTKTLLLIAVLPSFSAVPARADDHPAPAAPELKKTVDAFAGRWSFDGTLTLPDGKSKALTSKLTCSKVANGKAVSCLEEGHAADLGPSQSAFLIGYDTFGKRVHFMAITSDEAVHDHPCTWTSERDLTCEPLKGGMNGAPITEQFVVSFDGSTASIKVRTTMPDGSVMLVNLKGKREPARPRS
jgi:hypothetical protein